MAKNPKKASEPAEAAKPDMKMQDKIAQTYRAFLRFGADPKQNINIITELAGEMLHGACALYNRLDKGQLCAIGQWNTPPGFAPVDRPEGHICYDVIKAGSDTPVIIHNLQQTPYAKSDANVAQYQLKTYIGKAVRINDKCVGSLCVVYTQDYQPDDTDLEILGILTQAIAIEDQRWQAEDTVRQSEERFKAIFHNQQIGLLMVDAATHIIVDANKTALSMIGSREEDIIGKVCHTCICPAERGRCPVTDLGQTVDNSERILINVKGEQIHVLKSVSTIQIGKKPFLIESFIDITERKKAEEALRDSEEKFRALVETTNDFIWEVDEAGTYTYVSPKVRDMLGYEPAAVIGKTPFDFMPPDEAERVAVEFGKYVATRQPLFSLENRNVRSDGTTVILDTSGVPRFDKNGVFTGYRGIDRDITDRKNAEKALQQNEVRFKAIFHNQLTGLLMIDADTHMIIDANKTALSLIGAGKEEVVGKVCHTYICPAERGHCPVTDLGKTVDNSERILINAKNERVPVIKSVTKIEIEGKPYLIESFIDITDRKNAEAALRQSEERFKAIFHNQLTGLLMIDADTHMIIDANKTALSLIGAGKEEVIGKACHTYICPAERGRCPVTDLGQTVDNSERILINAKNEQVPVIKSVSRIEIEGKPYLIESFIDITERKALQESVQMANRKLNLLSSITRHDIINQLTLLTGYIRISHGYLDKKDTLVKFLDKADKAATTIEHHIRFTGEYQELGVDAPSWQNVHEIITKALMGLPVGDIHIEISGADFEILADRLCGKVFYNLIDNALRYGGEGMKTIRFLSQESDTGLSIICEDDGVGIEDDIKQRLFTRGFGKNTGLGLFLSREILSITGITISENGTPGNGARFEIMVPKGLYRFAASGQK